MEQTEKILVIADVHANEAAFQAIIADVRRRYTSLPPLWFLGDLVGRGPRPIRVWTRLISRYVPEAIVAGNHDWGLIYLTRTFQGKFNKFDWQVILAHQRQMGQIGILKFDSNQTPIDSTVYETIRNWPIVHSPRPGIYLVHGGLKKYEFEPPEAIDTFLKSLVWGYIEEAVHAHVTYKAISWLAENWHDNPYLVALHDNIQPPTLVLFGHIHRRYLYFADDPSPDLIEPEIDYAYNITNKAVLASPGAVSFQREADRTDKDASYAILELQNQQPSRLTFHKVPYDYASVRQEMAGNGYPLTILNYLRRPGE